MSSQDPQHPFGTCGCAKSEHETHPDSVSQINARIDAAFAHLAAVLTARAAAR